MSDAVSSIQLGVETKQGLDHLIALRQAFAGLRQEMEQFSASKSSLDTLTGGAASASSAIDKLTAELDKSKREAQGLRTLVDQLAKAQRELAQAAQAAGQAQAGSAKDVTQAVAGAATAQTKVVTENLDKQVAATQAAAKAEADAVEESARRIKRSQSEKVGRQSISMSEPATQTEFEEAALRNMLAQQAAYMAKRDNLEAVAEDRHRAIMLASSMADEATLNKLLAQQAEYLAKRDALREAAEATGRADRLQEVLADQAVIDKMLAEQAEYLAKRSAMREAADAAHRTDGLMEVLRDQATIDKLLAQQAEYLAKREALREGAEAQQRNDDLQEVLRDQAVIDQMLAQQKELMAKREALRAKEQAEYEAGLLVAVVKDEEARQKRIAAAEREHMALLQEEAKFLNGVYDMQAKQQAKLAALREKDRLERLAEEERDRVKNTAFLTASPAQKLRTVEKAITYKSLGGDVGSKYGSETEKFTSSGASIAQLRNDVAALEKELKKLGGTTGAASMKAKENADITRAQAESMREAHSAARGLAGGMDMLWVTWGSMVPLVAGAAITASLKNIYTTGKEVQYQLAFVQALGDKPIDLDKFLKVNEGSMSSLKDAAGGVRALSQAGLNASEVLQVLPTVLDLAAIGEMTVGQAALATTGVLEAFSLKISEVGRVGDVFAKMAAISNTSVEAMTEAMKQGSTIGEMFKVKLEEAGATMAVLAKRNIEGSAAGTSLTTALKNLYEPSEKARKVMAEIGLTTVENNGKLKNYSQLMEELAQKLSGFNESSRQLILGNISDQRGAKTLSAITSDMDGYRKALGEAQNAQGFMSDGVAKLADTVEGSARRMANAVSNTFMGAFQGAEPIIRATIDSLSVSAKSEEFVSAMNRMALGAAYLTKVVAENLDGVGRLILLYGGFKVLTGVVAGLAAVEAALIAQGVAATGAAVATTAATGATTALATASRLLASTPLGLLITAIGLVTAGYYAWAASSDTAVASEQKIRNSIDVTIQSLDREIERLRERERLLNGGKEAGGPAGAIEQGAAEVEQMRADRAQLQKQLKKLKDEEKLRGSQGTSSFSIRGNSTASEIETLTTKINDLDMALAVASDRSLEVAKRTSTVNALQAKDTLKSSIKTLMNDAGGREDGSINPSRGNAKSHALIAEIKQLRLDAEVAQGPIDGLNKRLESLQDRLSKSLGTYTPPAKGGNAAANDAMNAEINAIKMRLEGEQKLLKAEERTDQQKNKRGEIGDLELLNNQRERAVQAEQNLQRSAQQEIAIYEKNKNQLHNIATLRGKITNSKDAELSAEELFQEKMATKVEQFNDESDKVMAEDQRRKGNLVSAYLIETERKYRTTRDKITSDLANPALMAKVGPEVKQAMERKVVALDTNQQSGLLGAEFQQTKNGFDAMYADMEAKLESINTKATNAGNVGAAVRAAEQADAIRSQLIPALQDAQQEMLRLAMQQGDPQKIKEALNYGKNLGKEAEKSAAQWLTASKMIEKSLESAFGKGGKAIGGMLVAYTQYSNQKKAIDEKMAKAQGEGDPVKREKAIADVQRESAEAQLNNFANLAGAAKGYFDQHSKGYAILQAAERGFRAVELVLAAEAFIRKTFFATATATAQVASIEVGTAANLASVAPNVAADSTKASASGVAAIAKTLASLPFPYNIAAGAAVLAALVGVGVAMAGGMGGSSSTGRDPAKDLQDRAGTQAQGRTGDIGNLNKSGPNGYYDWELVKSESIDKSLSLLKDNSNIALRHSSGMLVALQSIRDNIGGMAKAIANTSGLRGTYQDMVGQGFGSERGFLGFSSSSKELKDAGLEIALGQTLGQVLRNGLEAYKYQTINEKSSSFWGLDKSDDTYTNRQDADSGLKAQLVKTLDQMSKTVTASATYLNPGSNAVIQQVLDQFQINIGKMSFKDMKPDEIVSALEATFSKVGDDMAEAVMPGIDAFGKAGENAYQTLIRVSTGVEQARFALSKLGMTAVDVAFIANKTGDTGAEIVRTTIANKEAHWDSGNGMMATRNLNEVGKIIEEMAGSADELVEAYKKLVDIRTSMRMVSLNQNGLTQNTIYGAGGLDELQSGMNDYLSGMFTKAEQNQVSLQKLNEQFTALGVQLPKSKEEFRNLVNGLDLTSESGQKLFGKLVTLSGAFSDLVDDMGVANAALYRVRQTITTEQYKEQTTTMVEYAERWRTIREDATDMSATIRKSLFDIKKAAYDQLSGTKLTDAQRTLRASLLTELQTMQSAQEEIVKAKVSELWEQFNAKGLSPEQQLDLAGQLHDAIQERYDLELENNKDLIDLAKSLKGFLEDLKVGDLSPKTNAEKLQEAGSQYSETLALAQSGDSNAMDELEGKAKTYLEQARVFYASSDAYKEIFNQVYAELDNIKAEGDTAAASAIDLAQEQVDELRKLQDAVTGVQANADLSYDNAVQQLAAALAMQQAMEATLGVASTIPQLLADLPAGLTAALAAAGIVNQKPLGATPPSISALPTLAESTLPIDYKPPVPSLPSFFSVNFGSHAKGLDYVPFDGYRAELHKGERVLTAAATSRMDAGQAELVAEVAALRQEVAALRSDQQRQTGDLIRSNFEANDAAAEKVVDGHKEAADNAAWKQSSAATLI